ncbi:hypothetical protein ACIA8O_16935 [Kitasatospora sp. NPDC051853]|uniref:hypothetical protein n=1 Tax=Kitasatospora sp. NPDC051853 TaxID=3364058 RepID=UPI0037A89EB8
MTVLGPGTRDAVRRAMARPVWEQPFDAHPADSLRDLGLRHSTAAFVYGARGHLTPEQPGGAAAVDLEAVYLAAGYHAARLARLPGDSPWDEPAFEALFAVVLAVRPEVVPEGFRELTEEHPPRPAPAYEILNLVAAGLYEAAAAAADETSLALSVGLFGEALAGAGGSTAEPHVTFNLGSALLALSRLDRPALDPAGLRRAALHHLRRSLALLPADDPARGRLTAAVADALARNA